jgi:PAS domain S-box-containing protein
MRDPAEHPQGSRWPVSPALGAGVVAVAGLAWVALARVTNPHSGQPVPVLDPVLDPLRNWFRSAGLGPGSVELLFDGIPVLVGAIVVFALLRWRGGRVGAAEAAREDDRRRLRSLFESPGPAQALLDRDGGILEANRAFLRFFGYSEAELQRMSYPALTHPEDRDGEAMNMRDLLSGRAGGFRMKKRCLHADGRVLHTETAATIARRRNGDFLHIAVVLEDRTALHNAEVALDEREARYQKLLAIIDEGVLALDAAGRIRYASEGALELLGRPMDQIEGRALAAFVPEPDRARVRRAIEAAETRSVEMVWIRGEDDRLPLRFRTSPASDREGRRTGTLVLVADISAADRAEAAFEASQRTVRALLDATPHMAALVAADGVVLGVNEHAARWMDRPGEEIVGAALSRSLPEELRYLQRDLLGRVFANRRPERAELAWNDRQLLAMGYPVYDAERSVGQAVLFIEDRTEQHRAEEERQLLEMELYQAQKMEAVGRLAAGVAHDFNNRLGLIMGYAGLMKKQLASDPQVQKRLEKVLTAANQAADLTAKLLTFSRKSVAETVPVDIHQSVLSVVGLLEHSIDKRITIQQNLNASPHMIRGDSTQVQNMLFNLAVNACDAMAEGGILCFSTYIKNLEEGAYRSSGFEIRAGSYIEVSVADTGLGIDPEILPHIFEPFFTTKNIHEGTGLGLAVAYGTAKQHHGAIDVESEKGRGSVFKVYLPLASNPKSAPSAPPSEDIVRGEGLVLVIDDEADVADMAGDILEMAGYTVVKCVSVSDAFEFFRSNHGKVDLVLLDMMMPEMSGKDLFLTLRRVDPALKALVSSGYSRSGLVEETINVGALGYVMKPYGLTELTRAVDEAIRGEPASHALESGGD